MNNRMYLLEKYPDKLWNWGWISCNPNLTMKFIEKKIKYVSAVYL